MKATEQHINRSRQAHQSSYHYRISKAVPKVAKVILIDIGAIVGLTIGWPPFHFAAECQPGCCGGQGTSGGLFFIYDDDCPARPHLAPQCRQ